MQRRSILKTAAVALPLLAVGLPSQAQQTYPNRTITLIAPFSPGGALDMIARTIGQKIAEDLGQTVVVDNKAGAAGIIGTQFVARSAPDGYTILLGATTTHGINPSMYKKLSYDATKDFEPVSLIATIPHLLVVNVNSPVNNLQEFLKWGKSNPIAFGSAGVGSPHHLAGELLKSRTQIDAQHIPYKGTGPAMTGLMGGEIQFMSVETAAAMPHIKAGKLKALALAAGKRDASIDVATYAEQGLPKFEVYSWFAVYAPKGTPKDIVEKLSKSIAEATKKQDVKDRFATLGANPVGSTPAELGKFQQSEIELWANAVKISGASAD